MSKYLLIDFGASRIKSALADLGSGAISMVSSQPSAAPRSTGGTFEVPASELARKFSAICEDYGGRRGTRIDGVAVCSEMHGFAVLSSSGRAKTGYISWKDTRGMRLLNGVSSFDLVSRGLGPKFRAITGMTLRAGLPYLNAMHMARSGALKDGDRIVSLPELLVAAVGKGRLSCHETMTAGLGFYDIYSKKLSPELADFFSEETGVSPQTGGPAEDPVCGYLRCGGREIPVFAGIGDHQCAVLGAGNGPKTISVNVGTGSQVSVLSRRKDPIRHQQRPFFDGYLLDTITHIPAGRVLNEYVMFLKKTAEGLGSVKKDAWTLLAGVRPADVSRATLIFDLGIFTGAWGYSGGGSISGIAEGALTPDNYIASLLRSMAAQYERAIRELAPAPGRRILMSGGVAHKLPVLRAVLSRSTGLPVLVSSQEEETFSGLRAAVAVFSGCSANFVKAAECFNRRK